MVTPGLSGSMDPVTVTVFPDSTVPGSRLLVMEVGRLETVSVTGSVSTGWYASLPLKLAWRLQFHVTVGLKV